MGVRGDDEGTVAKRLPESLGCGTPPDFDAFSLRIAETWIIVGSESAINNRKSADTIR